MPSNQTPNYQLSQWGRTDKVLMEDFNADNAKIDGALAALAERDGALERLLAAKGNCQVQAFSYVGTSSEDKEGLSHTIKFAAKPALVLIFGRNSSIELVSSSGMGIFVGTYSALNGSRTVSHFDVTWNDTTLVLDGFFHQVRMDTKDVVYQVIAWIPTDT